MCWSVILNLNLHTKTDVMTLSGMWCETHFTTMICISQSVTRKAKIYLHTKELSYYSGEHDKPHVLLSL